MSRIGKSVFALSEEEQLFRDLFEDETQREVVIESLKADCEVRTGTGLRVFEVVSRR